ncbi:MAG: glycosyltransferase family 4 protein, partial [Longimicrobiales bacterium]
YILCVGRLADARKNVELLFRAYHRVRTRLPDPPRLVLAGRSAPGEQAWQVADGLGIRDWIDYVASPSDSQLVELYQGARLLALSSDEEGLGLVVLEAMACGLPVVSTRCGGPEETVVDGETGLLTPMGQEGPLANGIVHLLSDEVLSETMGKAGRARAEIHYSSRRNGDELLGVYRTLLRKQPRSHAAR